MANTKNLKPFTSDQSRDEAVKNGKKGGVRSGTIRKLNSDIKKLLQAALFDEYTDKITGETTTGIDGIIKKLITIYIIYKILDETCILETSLPT